MAEGQQEWTFNSLNGEHLGFRVAECRVVVTPDESLTGETQQPTEPTLLRDKDGFVGLCRRCKKGDVYRIKFDSGITEIRCTYCG